MTCYSAKHNQLPVSENQGFSADKQGPFTRKYLPLKMGGFPISLCVKTLVSFTETFYEPAY